MTASYTLYGTEISYYTGKVRAFLRWKRLPFEEVLSDASVYRNVIVPKVGVRAIPVLVTPQGELLQDSTDIIDAVERRHPEPAVYPAGPVQRFLALWIETVADEWMLIPAMHYRWHHDAEWAMQQFGAVNLPEASPQEQFAIGQQIAAPFAKAAENLGAHAGMREAVEASYEALLDELDAHFKAHPALIGGQPCLADFGLIGPLYAHQYRDPTAGALMRSRAPNLVRWVEQTQLHPAGFDGALLAGDACPDSLLPALRRWASEFLPVLEDTAHRASAWMAEHPGELLPRALGRHRFRLGAAEGERIVRPYSLWMLQRVLDHLGSLTGDDRARVERVAADAGAGALFAFPRFPRLERVGLTVKPAA
ncbi:MAG TPA: glutathione S-transferase [Rhizobacter sp.]